MKRAGLLFATTRFPLWNKHIALGSIEIEHPSVSLIRFADGTWNVDRLAKKKSEPDSLPSPWVVAVKNLRINNGHFRLIDSTAQSNHDLPDSIARRTFNFSNLDIEKLNVELSATISEQQQSASIKNISFVTSREGFTLAHFSGDLRHTAANSEVKNLLIVTPRSRIEFSAKISSVDALKIHDIASAPIYSGRVFPVAEHCRRRRPAAIPAFAQFSSRLGSIGMQDGRRIWQPEGEKTPCRFQPFNHQSRRERHQSSSS